MKLNRVTDTPTPEYTMRLAELACLLAQHGVKSASVKSYKNMALFTFGTFADAWHAVFILKVNDVDVDMWSDVPPVLALSLE